MIYSLEWLLPWLASAHDSTLVKIKVVILFRVSELAHDKAMSEHVSGKECKTDFSVTLGRGSVEWKHLEALTADQVVGQEGGGRSPLGTDEKGGFTTLGLDKPLSVEGTSETFLFRGSSLWVQGNVLVLHFCLIK